MPLHLRWTAQPFLAGLGTRQEIEKIGLTVCGFLCIDGWVRPRGHHRLYPAPHLSERARSRPACHGEHWHRRNHGGTVMVDTDLIDCEHCGREHEGNAGDGDFLLCASCGSLFRECEAASDAEEKADVALDE